MPEIEETPLPGVGKRVQFMTDDGGRLGVVHHVGGDRELFACSAADPDAVAFSVRLSDVESHALADVLGGSSVVESLSDLAVHIEGLAIDWLTVGEATPYVDKTIGDARVRTRTGVSVVAVLRGKKANPAPGPAFRIAADDTLVVVGTPDGIQAARELMASG